MGALFDLPELSSQHFHLFLLLDLALQNLRLTIRLLLLLFYLGIKRLSFVVFLLFSSIKRGIHFLENRGVRAQNPIPEGYKGVDEDYDNVYQHST